MYMFVNKNAAAPVEKGPQLQLLYQLSAHHGGDNLTEEYDSNDRDEHHRNIFPFEQVDGNLKEHTDSTGSYHAQNCRLTDVISHLRIVTAQKVGRTWGTIE